MGLCSGEKKKRAFRTIIIPRGIINPNEYNIIEIPVNLDTNSNLIVKARTDDNSCFSVEPYRGNFRDVANDLPRKGALPHTSTPLQSQSFPGTLNNTPSHHPPLPVVEDLRPRVNTSAQTQPSTSGYQSSTQQTSNTRVVQPPPPNTEVHSPICPICARASCSFNFSAERSYMHPRYGQCTPPSNFYVCPPPMSRCYADPTVRFPCWPPKSRNEDVELSKLLNEKIDKILKPMLFSLAKSTLDDVEREIERKPSCSIDSSCSFLYSKPCYEPPYSSRKCVIPDDDSYETYRRRDSDFNGRSRAKTSFAKNNNDSESSRRSADRDSDSTKPRRENCPPHASCNRRTNVSFGGESDRDESQDTDDLYLKASRHNQSFTSLNRRK